MTPPRRKLPTYRLHKASGQAIVTLSGRDIYLGPHGTRLSRDAYDRIVGEWLASGRVIVTDETRPGLVVVQLLNAFRKSNKIRPSQADHYKAVLTILARLYGRTLISEFGPLALAAVRQKFVDAGWKRRTVNDRIHIVRRIFRWGVAHEMVKSEQIVALEAVEGLLNGETSAPESVAINPVAIEHVEACITYMTPTIAAMVRVQMYTGMRAKEMHTMRTGDIDMSDPTCWVYRPGSHKTERFGKVREIPLGSKAMDVLRPLLKPDLSACIFTPAQAEAESRAQRTAARKTPANRGNAVGTKRVKRPKKKPGDKFTTSVYRQAIERATRKAFPHPLDRRRSVTAAEWVLRVGPEGSAAHAAFRKAHHWHPHQLRHAFGTLVINQFSAEHAQRSLGHSNLKATQIYAKLSLDKAKEVARAIG